MKRLFLCAAAALLIACGAGSACDTCGCTKKKEKQEGQKVTGIVKVAKEGEKTKSITLSVNCKAECGGCDRDATYTVKNTADGAVAKLDGKTVEITGHLDAEKKTIEAEAVVEKK